jgi:hypothetical protein
MKLFLTILLVATTAFAQLTEDIIYQVTTDSFGFCQVKKITYILKDGKPLSDVPMYHVEVAEPDDTAAFARIPKEQQDMCKASWIPSVKARHSNLKKKQKDEIEKKFGK